MFNHGLKDTWRVMVLKWKMMLDKDGRPLRKVIMIESKHLRKLLIFAVVAWISSVIYVYKTATDGRDELAKQVNRINTEQTISSRSGCERGKLRALETAQIIVAIADALRDTDMRRDKPLTDLRINSEETIADGIKELMQQSTVDCRVSYPLKKKVK